MGGVRAKATIRRFAIADDPNDSQKSFQTREERDLVAEACCVNGRYDHKPAVRELETFFDDQVMGLVEVDSVTDELDELDTVFTTSLVVNL